MLEKEVDDGSQGFDHVEEETRKEEAACPSHHGVFPIGQGEPADVDATDDERAGVGDGQMGVSPRRVRQAVSLKGPGVGDSNDVNSFFLGEFSDLIK